MIGFLKKHRHYGVRSLFVLLAASAVINWLPLSHGVLKTLGYALLPLTMIGIVVTRSHDHSGMCPDCASATPLDPQEAVDRSRPWLRVFHLIHDSSKRFMIGAYVYLGLLVGSAVVFDNYSVGSNVTTDMACLVVGLMLGSSTVHRRLHPWCPWCHWEGHGDHEPSPDVPKVPADA